jgi:hypothetical protein
MDTLECSREKWLEAFRELQTEKEIYLKFEFQAGRMSATLSHLQVNDNRASVMVARNIFDSGIALRIASTLGSNLLFLMWTSWNLALAAPVARKPPVAALWRALRETESLLRFAGSLRQIHIQTLGLSLFASSAISPLRGSKLSARTFGSRF